MKLTVQTGKVKTVLKTEERTNREKGTTILKSKRKVKGSSQRQGPEKGIEMHSYFIIGWSMSRVGPRWATERSTQGMTRTERQSGFILL